MTATKEQRSLAAKKAAATRKRNQAKGSAQDLAHHLGGLKHTGENIADGVKDTVKTAGAAAKSAAEVAAQRVESGLKRD
jgi:hypothetical protein